MKYCLVAICLFSKFVILKATKDQTASITAKCLVDMFINYGFPSTILTDRGTGFMSELMKNFLVELRVNKLSTSSYNPMCNGNVERQMSTIKQILKSYLEIKYLPYIQFAINSSIHDTTKVTPFEIVFGKRPRIPLDHSIGALNFTGRESIAKEIQLIRELVKTKILEDRVSNKQGYDKNREEFEFIIGDLVLLYNPTATKKLCRLYTGPYIIQNELSSVNYEIKSLYTHVSSIVNIKRLKPYQQRIESSSSEEDKGDLSKEEWLNRLQELHSFNKNPSYYSNLFELWELENRVIPDNITLVMRTIELKNVLKIKIHTPTNLNESWPIVLHNVQNSLLLAIINVEIFHKVRLNKNNLEVVLWPENPENNLCKAKLQLLNPLMDTDCIAQKGNLETKWSSYAPSIPSTLSPRSTSLEY